jgi:hypothetical protein
MAPLTRGFTLGTAASSGADSLQFIVGQLGLLLFGVGGG